MQQPDAVWPEGREPLTTPRMVLVAVTIYTDGTVSEAHVTDPKHDAFDAAALASAKRATFVPKHVHCEAVEGTYLMRYQFGPWPFPLVLPANAFERLSADLEFAHYRSLDKTAEVSVSARYASLGESVRAERDDASAQHVILQQDASFATCSGNDHGHYIVYNADDMVTATVFTPGNDGYTYVARYRGPKATGVPADVLAAFGKFCAQD